MMNSSAGNAIMISVSRETIVSAHPRKYPAIAPGSTPISTEMSVEKTATCSDMRRAVQEPEEHVAADRPVRAEDEERRCPRRAFSTRVIGPTGRNGPGRAR